MFGIGGLGGLGGLGGFGKGNGFQVEGTVLLMKKEFLEFGVTPATTIIDGITEFLGNSISLQLVSATVVDPNSGNRGVVGEPAHLEQYFSLLKLLDGGESKFKVKFQWDESKGIPGAVIVKNNKLNEFLLKTITIEDFPGKGRIHFVCDSWVYPTSKYTYDRIFFANTSYLPKDTPEPLRPYREEELFHLRGDSVTRRLEEADRIYNYDYYNDLGIPDLGSSFARPVLGGSEEYPYPRRGRTNRPRTLTDPNSEGSIPLVESFYIPRDEKFGHVKQSDFLGYLLKSISTSILPLLKIAVNLGEFNTFEDVLRLYAGGVPLPSIPIVDEIRQRLPIDLIGGLVSLNNQGESLLKLPLPDVIKVDRDAWKTDEEFAREMIAGVNPLIIRRLQEFPPTSKLDPSKYGNQTSTITAAHIGSNLDGLTIEQAMASNRLYILDHHDTVMPYVNRINATFNRVYATRTLLFLKDDGTLKPLAIELSLPHPQGEKNGAVSKVITPSETGVEGSIWQLAKAYVGVNDSGVHQLVSHWLHTHACMEPFVLATNRHLSVVHPVYKLLYPHFRDTMNINSLARQILVNTNGIIESTFFQARYAMEMSAKSYKTWNFTQQALPADLLSRGVAVEDPSSPHKLRLLIEDYPYAVDGLDIWSAIETWVTEYCSVYYPDDAAVQADPELQAWWKEVREVGHGDLKDEAWWPKMQTLTELVQSCTTVIWVGSALHAAVNFGQYPYGGYSPNRPTLSRRFLPESGTKEYEELKNTPEKAFLRTITSQVQSLVALSVIEVLSTHTSDEIYLGQRPADEWTTDKKALEAFKKFGEKLKAIEANIIKKNQDPSLKNRNGPVKMPYTLLIPSSKEGVTRRGIPNSISI